jgi:hypothetical protein
VSTRVQGIERLDWSEVADHLRREWSPGEHFSLVAPTGYGKSHMVMRGLIPRWTHVITLDVKGDDPIVRAGAGRRVKGFPTRLDLLREETMEHPSYRFRVFPGSLGPAARRSFDDVFRKAWAAGAKRKPGNGAWVLNVDEARILSDKLKMRDHLETMWIMGRSRGITMVASTQAPRWVPREFYDQASWIAIGRQRDEDVIRRLKEVGGTLGDSADVRKILPALERSDHRREFLIVGPDDFAAITSWEPGR